MKATNTQTLIFNAIKDALTEIEKSPNDSMQDIFNEQLWSWRTGFKMNHRYEIEPDSESHN